jgi:transposase
MFREVSPMEIREVLRQRQRGRPRREVARALHLDRKTVRRYEELAVAAGYNLDGQEVTDDVVAAVAERVRPGRREGCGRGASWSAMEQEHEYLRERLKSGLRLSKVQTLLLRRGVEVPYRTLHRYCARSFPELVGGVRETVRVDDGEPGKELQVDFGRLGMIGRGTSRQRLVRGLILTACVSRHQFCWVTYGETLPEVIEGFEEAWLFFGGVFSVVIVDNLRAVIDRADRLHPTINATFLEYAQGRGFVVDACEIRSPTQKSRVERAVPYCRESGFVGEDFAEITAARAGMRRWCLEEAGMRIHGTTRRQPLEHFHEIEQGRLLPPPTTRYDTPIIAQPKVARDHHVQVAHALYSVPGDRIGQHVEVRADSRLVRISQHGQLLREHPRKSPGGRSTVAEDLPLHKRAYAMRDVEYLKKQATEQGEHVGIYAVRLLEDPLPWTQMRKVYKLLSLARRFGAERVESACRRTLDLDVVDVAKVQRIVEGATRPADNETRRWAPILRPRFAREPAAFEVTKDHDHA